MLSSATYPQCANFQRDQSPPTTQPAADPSSAKGTVMDATTLAALIGSIIILAVIGTVAVQTNRDTNHDDNPLFTRKR